MLCPNELGCSFSRFLTPKTSGEPELFEMFDGTFLLGDLCNFKITNPSKSDMNDVMYIRLEYYARCKPILIKGESLENPIAMYTLNIGQDYTALRGINFFLLFISTDESSGDFVFKIWFNSVAGFGKEAPTSISYEAKPQSASEFGTVETKIKTNTTTTTTTPTSTNATSTGNNTSTGSKTNSTSTNTSSSSNPSANDMT